MADVVKLVIFVALFVLTKQSSAKDIPFDGVIRPMPDGRVEAFLIPPFGSNHASNIEIIPNRAGMGNDMLVSWFSGTKEGQSDVAIVLSRLYAGSRVWTNATVMSQRKGYSNQNPVIFFYNTTQSQKVFLFHSQQKADAGESNADVWVMESDPNALNWTTPKPLFTKPGSFDRNRMLLTLKDSALLPIYYSGDKSTSSIMEWKGGEVTDGKMWAEHTMKHTNYLEQPSVVRPAKGSPKLIAFFRDSRSKHIYRAVSDDDGVTWSKPTKTPLPNNNSGIQACALTSGNVALVYNPTTDERNPLVISLSEDMGLTWKYTRTLIMSSDKGSEFSYPSIIQDPRDGIIHITHTYNRNAIRYNNIPNEDWIKAKGH